MRARLSTPISLCFLEELTVEMVDTDAMNSR